LSPKLEITPAGEWGATVGALLARRLGAQPGTRLCLPTGNTPEPAYAAFAAVGGSLAATEVFLLDEFVLPNGHPARCDVMLRRALLDRLPDPPQTLHRLDVGADDLDAESARYEALVAEKPVDLTLLGLGGNGHLGLNEPGTAIDSPTRVVALHHETVRHAADYGEGITPELGVTLGMQSILASGEIWLLVTGGHKAEILARALTGPVGPDVPASYLQEHANTTVLADEDAAAQLR
jgi:glucosamine-6-phosphate deaminase